MVVIVIIHDSDRGELWPELDSDNEEAEQAAHGA